MKIYQLKSGDTLSELAETIGVSVDAFMFVNPTLINADNIVAGNWIYVPEIFDLDTFKSFQLRKEYRSLMDTLMGKRS